MKKVTWGIALRTSFLFWMLLRNKRFILQSFRILNQRGPLRFVEMLHATGYTNAREHSEDTADGAVEAIRKGLRLATLIGCAEDGTLHVVYDTGHDRCPHATFNITVAGQTFLENIQQHK